MAETATTLEQQLAAIMHGAAIDTLQINAVREDDGAVRFYTSLHAGGVCAFSDYLNLPSIRAAIEGGIKALNEKRLTAPTISDLPPMADAA